MKKKQAKNQVFLPQQHTPSPPNKVMEIGNFRKITLNYIYKFIYTAICIGAFSPLGVSAMTNKLQKTQLDRDSEKINFKPPPIHLKKFLQNIDSLEELTWNYYPVSEQSRRQALDLATTLAGEGMKLHLTVQPLQQATIFDFIKSDNRLITICEEMHFDFVAKQISISCKKPQKSTIDALLKLLGKPLKSTEGPIVDPHGTSELVFHTSNYQRKGASYVFSGREHSSFDEFKVTIISK